MRKTKHVARRLVVERDFQYRYTFLVCLISGSIFLAFGGIVLYFHQLNYKLLIDEALIQIPSIVDNLKSEVRILTWGIIVAFTIMVSILFALGLIVTQRVAGPILSLKKRLREFTDGKNVRLYLRQNDEFRNLQEIFNHAMETHEGRNTLLVEGLRECLDASKAGDQDKVQDLLTNLQEKIKFKGQEI